MFAKRLVAPVAAALLLAPLAGCHSSTDTGTASSGTVHVVASLYPLAWLVEQVGGTHVSVENLVTPGAEPHDITLTPKQVAAVSEAGLVVYQKDMNASVDDAIAQATPAHALDVSTLVTMQQLSEGSGIESDTGLDPHTWLDPVNMQKMAAGIAAQLESVDSAHKADYESNLQQTTATLKTLDSSYSSGLASCQRTVFITSHAAFGYLATRYHLTQVGVSGISPEAEPSPARIAEVQKLATKYKVTTIFTETLASPALAKSIAGDLGLKTDVLDPIEGIVAGESRGNDYVAVMQSNLTALRTANGCR